MYYRLRKFDPVAGAPRGGVPRRARAPARPRGAQRRALTAGPAAARRRRRRAAIWCVAINTDFIVQTDKHLLNC